MSFPRRAASRSIRRFAAGTSVTTGVPSRADRVVGNALFVSLSRYPFLWSEAELARMAAETVEWQPQFLDVDPVYGVVFALYCERRGIRLPSLRFILASYEFVSVVHRRILERVFGVPVFNLYGSTETGHLLMEDEARRDAAQPTKPPCWKCWQRLTNRRRELAVTTLTNDFMPLIRYRIGDLVERAEAALQHALPRAWPGGGCVQGPGGQARDDLADRPVPRRPAGHRPLPAC